MDSETPRSEQIEEAAVRWFLRQQSGAWSESDRAHFDAWLEATTAHRVQYLRVVRVWEQAARMKALGAGVSPGVVPSRDSWGDALFSRGGSLEPQASPTHAERSSAPEGNDDGIARSQGRATSGSDASNTGRDAPSHAVSHAQLHPEARTNELSQQADGARATARAGMRLQLFSAAAAAVALLVGVIYIVSIGLLEETRYSTSVGGIDYVTLADGSKITLNTDTRIRVSLSDRERRIRLDRGEAFFEVAKDGSRPFVVYAGEKRVMAVGTKFSVRRDQDDVRVVVTEGRVALATASSRSEDAGGGFAKRIADVVVEGIGRERGERVSAPPIALVDAGAIARTSRSEVLVRSDAESEAEKLLSWRAGYVAFDNVPLAEAVSEFNRYSVRKIVIEDPEVAGILVGGNFRSNNSEAFLALLQSGFPIAVEERDDQVVLRSR